VVTHGIYLMNFASPDDANWEKAIAALVVHLEIGALIGATAVVVHPGSGLTLDIDAAIARCATAMRRVLERTENLADRPTIALETCAGAGKTIGKTFSELAGIIDGANHHPGLGLCLDTAHMFGSGYDVATEDGLAATIADLDQHLSGVPVLAIHANDSKVPLASNKDRHENIGHGLIGEPAFARMLAHPRLRPIPWILEVPGMENDGPDAANIATMRRLARN
jgi:deoxyribonuclease-4